MWRALFLGIGVYLMIAGAECLAVDRVIWRGPRARSGDDAFSETGAPETEGFPPRPVGPLEPPLHGGRGLPVLVHHPEADGWRQVSGLPQTITQLLHSVRDQGKTAVSTAHSTLSARPPHRGWASLPGLGPSCPLTANAD